ncbi:MAG: hypothetical protein ACMUEM_05775 [Flavobacteriales bacterium AspAUS03]
MPELGRGIQYFDDKVFYKQKVKTLSTEPFNIKTEVEFQICDENHCLLPNNQYLPFQIDLKISSDDISNRQGVDFIQ